MQICVNQRRRYGDKERMRETNKTWFEERNKAKGRAKRNGQYHFKSERKDALFRMAVVTRERNMHVKMTYITNICFTYIIGTVIGTTKSSTNKVL